MQVSVSAVGASLRFAKCAVEWGESSSTAPVTLDFANKLAQHHTNPKEDTMIVAPLLLAVLLAPAAPQGNQKCVQDARTCLLRFFEMYLKALEIRKPETLPVAPDVKVTEDSKQLKFGEGLWTTVSRVCGAQLVAADVAQGVVAGHVLVEENGSPVLADVHLKVVNEKITEIETLVTRNQSQRMISCRR